MKTSLAIVVIAAFISFSPRAALAYSQTCRWVAFLNDNEELYYAECCQSGNGTMLCDFSADAVFAKPRELELCYGQWVLSGECQTPQERLMRRRARDILNLPLPDPDRFGP